MMAVRGLFILCFVLALAAPCAAQASGSGGHMSDSEYAARYAEALRKGIDFLSTFQQPDGSWDRIGNPDRIEKIDPTRAAAATQGHDYFDGPVKDQADAATANVADTCLTCLALLGTLDAPHPTPVSKDQIRKGAVFVCAQISKWRGDTILIQSRIFDPLHDQTPAGGYKLSKSKDPDVQLGEPRFYDPTVDTFFALWFLSAVQDRFDDRDSKEIAKNAIDILMQKIERCQSPEGTWEDDTNPLNKMKTWMDLEKGPSFMGGGPGIQEQIPQKVPRINTHGLAMGVLNIALRRGISVPQTTLLAGDRYLLAAIGKLDDADGLASVVFGLQEGIKSCDAMAAASKKIRDRLSSEKDKAQVDDEIKRVLTRRGRLEDGRKVAIKKLLGVWERRGILNRGPMQAIYPTVMEAVRGFADQYKGVNRKCLEDLLQAQRGNGSFASGGERGDVTYGTAANVLVLLANPPPKTAEPMAERVAEKTLAGPAVAAATAPAATAPQGPKDPLEFMHSPTGGAGASSAEGAKNTTTSPAKIVIGGTEVTIGAAQRPGRTDTLFRHKPKDLNEAQLQTAIDQGVAYLLKRYERDGDPHATLYGADTVGQQSIGIDALSLYALLQVGYLTQDERLSVNSKQLAPLIKNLAEAQTNYTYAAALQASALALLPNRPEYRKPLNTIRDSIVNGCHDGAFGYIVPQPNIKELPVTGALASEQWWDNSNSQYALLAAWACQDVNVEVSNDFWKQTNLHWRKTQLADGRWAYHNMEGSSPPGSATYLGTPSMTAAGVASLFVTMDHVNGELRLDPLVDKAIERGLICVTVDLESPMSTLGEDLYYTYGIERVGLASGRKYLGQVNWYREGAAYLAQKQHPDGSWDYFHGITNPQVGTAYALLFLARGRAPVVFNKLEYEGPWDARPRDAANFARWFARQTEAPAAWQVVNTNSDVEDWLDAPLLLITGHGDPQFNAQTIDRLRQFIDAGGIVFSTADGSDQAFTTAIRACANLVCRKRYEMRELPNDHPLFNLYRKVKAPPHIWALSNGARECWVHCPADAGAAWQMYALSKNDLWEVPANLYMYATGMQRPKSRPFRGPADRPAPAIGKTRLTRVEYAGNWDPEPGAWPTFAKYYAQHTGRELQLSSVPMNRLNAATDPIAHLTGTTAVILDDAAQAKLKAYILGGGTVFIDSAGGGLPFAKAIRQTLVDLFPQDQVVELDADDPLYRAAGPGLPALKTVSYTRTWRAENANSDRPRIYGLTINGRRAVYLSDADITVGLLDKGFVSIRGYTGDSARQLAAHLLLSADPRKE